MKVDFGPDYPLNDESCRENTGKTMAEWFDLLAEQTEVAHKRRYAIDWLYHQTGKKNDLWWPTTLWVQRERRDGTVLKDGRLEGYNICVTKTISAPIEKVYAAWLGDGPAAWWGDSPSVAADGSIADATGNQGTATRVRENKDLRYKWKTAGSEETTDLDVVFTDKGNGKTGLMLSHSRLQDRDEADGLRRAWGAAFERLKAACEAA